MKTDFMKIVNLLTTELQLRVEGSNLLSNLLSLFLKKVKTNIIFSLKLALNKIKSSSDGRYWSGLLGWPGFIFFPVFHDLDLPPFQKSSARSYFPE